MPWKRYPSTKTVHYLSLSGLLLGDGDASMGRRRQIDLKSRIKRVFGVQAASECKAMSLRSALKQHECASLLSVLQQIKLHCDDLASANVCLLVLDMNFEVDQRDQRHMIGIVQDIWCNGLDILVPLEDGLSISFDKMAEVVNGMDFLPLYIRQLWCASDFDSRENCG